MSAPTASTDALGSAAAIRLVAGREISARLGSKGFRLTTLAFVLAVIAGGVFTYYMHDLRREEVES